MTPQTLSILHGAANYTLLAIIVAIIAYLIKIALEKN
jgi:hypothetical protein